MGSVVLNIVRILEIIGSCFLNMGRYKLREVQDHGEFCIVGQICS